MRRFAAGTLLCAAALSSACIGEVIDGSGRVVTESRPVSGFTAVSMGGSGQLFVEQGASDSLTITTDDNLLPYISAEVRGDQLLLDFHDSFGSPNLRPTKGIVYKLTVKMLDEVDISGSGTADATRVDAKRMRLGISGSGRVTAQGSAGDLSVNISGSGKFVGDQLKSTRALVDISGSGKALVAASDRLDVDVSGSGAVEYVGSPRVSQSISGSGSVRRVD